jgi:hypothetical protein
MSEQKRRCFVIGPIGKEGSPERKHADMFLNAVVREALKDCDPAYEVIRSDTIADPGMITDRMIHEIMHAELVVADLTFLNANAFYELGIRHAAGKPVIHFAQLGTEIPFDAMAYRAVMQDITSWEGMERARQQIREAVSAIEAPGYRVSNPITQANASFKMLQSADPSEQFVADLLRRVERLEARGRGEQMERYFGRRGLYQLIIGELEHGSDADRMLMAGLITAHGPFGFSPDEANSVLAELGLPKIADPLQAMQQNLLANRVIEDQGRYRVSDAGHKYLRQRLGVYF